MLSRHTLVNRRLKEDKDMFWDFYQGFRLLADDEDEAKHSINYRPALEKPIITYRRLVLYRDRLRILTAEHECTPLGAVVSLTSASRDPTNKCLNQNQNLKLLVVILTLC